MTTLPLVELERSYVWYLSSIFGDGSRMCAQDLGRLVDLRVELRQVGAELVADAAELVARDAARHREHLLAVGERPAVPPASRPSPASSSSFHSVRGRLNFSSSSLTGSGFLAR